MKLQHSNLFSCLLHLDWSNPGFQSPWYLNVNKNQKRVSSSNDALKKRVEAVLDMAVTTVSSLSEAFSSGALVASDNTGLLQDKDKDLVEL